MHENLIQGTDEWKKLRAGKVTASRVADVIAKTKTGVSASREKYAGELVAERLTGEPADRYTNSAMAWGNDMELAARRAYEFYRDTDVVEVGFVDHPTIAETGASPDGLVDADGLLEIKCPETHTHIATLRSRSIPSKYVTQMMWQMACTGRKWCDFVSYDPRMPEAMQFFCQRVHRDDKVIAELEREVADFLKEVCQTVAELKATYQPEEQEENLLMAGE